MFMDITITPTKCHSFDRYLIYVNEKEKEAPNSMPLNSKLR